MIDVVVLAAGASSRFGSDKLVAEVAGRPLLAVTLDVVVKAIPASQVIVVVGPGDEERADLARAAGARVVVAEHAGRGMRWSIHAGLEAVHDDASGAAVVLADDPLAARALGSVLAVAGDEVVAVRRAVPAPHPVYLPRAAWPAAPTEADDTGLRTLLGDTTSWLDLPGSRSHDVDVPADVAGITTQTSSPSGPRARGSDQPS